MKPSVAEKRILELRKKAKADPAGYARRIAWTLRLGTIALIFFMILSLALLCVSVGLLVTLHLNYIVLMLAFGSVAFLGSLISMSFRQSEPPEGVEVSRESAPKIWAIADRATSRLNCPTFDQVRISESHTAYVRYWRPRAMFGAETRILTLGIPLLMALTEEQCEAVILHEAAHFSRGHVDAGKRCATALRTWVGLAEGTEGNGYTLGSVAFAKWYVPHLAIVNEGISLENEFECDRLAAKIATPEVAGTALLATMMSEALYLKPYGDRLEEAEDEFNAPAFSFFEGLSTQLKTPSSVNAFDSLCLVLRDLGDPLDSHPCMHHRLLNIGLDVDPYDDKRLKELAESLARPVDRSAWDAWHSPQLGLVAQRLGESVKKSLAEALAEKAEEKAKKRKQYEELLEQRATKPLTTEEQTMLAAMTHGFEGVEAALPMYRQLLAATPDDPSLLYLTGTAELEIDPRSSEGATHLRKLADIDDSLDQSDATATLYSYYLLTGNPTEANILRHRALTARAREADTEEEIQDISINADYRRYEGDIAPLQSLIPHLEAQTQIREVVVVARHLKGNSKVSVPGVFLLYQEPFITNAATTAALEQTVQSLLEGIPDGWQLVSLPRKSPFAKRIRAKGGLLWKKK